MSNKFSSGKNAIAECDVCGFRYKLSELKVLIVKTKATNILACPECNDPDHPQLQLGMYPVEDPQAVRNPRPDNSYYEPQIGSRIIQWNWAPVGPPAYNGLTPNDLGGTAQVGTVAIVVS
jgi:hypothetical protein